MLSRLVPLCSLSLTALAGGFSWAQEYPSKPIRIVTSVPGGASDFAARIIAQRISGPLGQQVIVDNRSGILGQEMVIKAAPDGYTLIVDGASLWVAPVVQKTFYETLRDFAPVALVARAPNILVVHPSLPVKTVKDLIALAKARPGELNYASGNTGAATHLAPELFKSMAGVNIVRIPYKGAGPALNDVMAGHVQLMFASAGSVVSHVKSGRLRAIAITTLQPSVLVPGVPTIAATGLPGYDLGTGTGIFAPAKTPIAIVNRLNQEIVQVLNKPEVKEKFISVGVEAAGSSPDEFAAAIKADMAKVTKIMKDSGIRAE